jgi:hypothetical protein
VVHHTLKGKDGLAGSMGVLDGGLVRKHSTAQHRKRQ